MQTVFLSYAREDGDRVCEIERDLAVHGVRVWRDQEQLRAGQHWPRALGEAIAASDALLLVWSARAAASDFVELEWCTALALKRAVIPCLTDDTPLPASLAGVQAVQLGAGSEGSDAAREIVAGLGGETNPAESAFMGETIRRLGDIGGGAPAEVLPKARAVFAQNQWTVQGPVYQAGGDIHIGTPVAGAAKTGLDSWAARVGIAAGLVTIVMAGLQLAQRQAAKQQVAKPVVEEKVQEQTLAGMIAEGSEPLAGVRVSVTLGSKVVATGETDPLGGYRFQIAAPPDADVTVISQKEGYVTDTRYARVGNTGFNFTMERKRR